jgi:F-type H+-transporting ATPase subunit delta
VEEVAKRYAHAFFEGNEQIAGQLEGELGQIWAQITSRHDLEQILIHPEVDMAAKKAVINDLTEDAIPQTRRILNLLLDHKRLELLGDILTVFRRLRLAAQGEIEVHVESVLAVDPTVKESIEQLITKITGLKPVITETVNPELLGGIRLGFGDVLLDGSARKSLAECVEIIRGKNGK